MRKIAFIVAITFLISPVVLAETVKSNGVACVSEKLLNEMLGYVTKKDNNGAKKLLGSGQCMSLKQGEQVSILRPGILTATILYNGKQFYTTSDILR